MSVKNSRVRLQRRRVTALENFRIIPKEEWEMQNNRPDDTWDAYVERKQREETALRDRIKRA